MTVALERQGSSGTRIVVTLLGRLERVGLIRDVAAMCMQVDVGRGTTLLIERT